MKNSTKCFGADQDAPGSTVYYNMQHFLEQISLPSCGVIQCVCVCVCVCKLLTVFLVKKNLKLVLLVLVERVFNLLNSLIIREFSVHEAHPTGLLHNFGPVISRSFAEGFIAINNGIIHYLSVRQQKTCIGWKVEYESENIFILGYSYLMQVPTFQKCNNNVIKNRQKCVKLPKCDK